MKNQTVLASLLLLFAGFVASIAQQTAHSYPPKTDKIFRHQQEKYDDSFNQDPLPWQTSALNPNSIDNHNTLNAIIPDFQVNENSATAGAVQSYPDVSIDSDGNFVVTWQDERNGDPDIYAQRYSADGTPLGDNFRVNDDLSSGEQERPAICTDRFGNFIITWYDRRRYSGSVYAQRFNSDGIALDTNFRVNEKPGIGLFRYPDICTDSEGNFTITWQDKGYIFARRYDQDGNPLGEQFNVIDNSPAGLQHNPAISSNDSGYVVITWEDRRNYYRNIDIYAQCYLDDGRTQGINYQINEDPGGLWQSKPAIARDDSANFVITWRDWRHGNGDIYAQRLAYNTYKRGVNFMVNDDQASIWHDDPAISCSKNGDFVICWADARGGNNDLYAQRYSRTGVPLGTNFTIGDDAGDADQGKPAISMNGSGHFVVVWEDSREGARDIFLQRFGSDGAPLGINIKVNDDQHNAKQEYPALAAGKNSGIIYVWADRRQGNWDIFAQRRDGDGNPLGHNFKVNDDQGDADQKHPSISTDHSGNFIISWMDHRNDNWDIYAQHFAYDGSPIGINFKANDDDSDADQRYPAMTCDPSGNLVIAWEDERTTDWFKKDIYAQRYDLEGFPIAGNFKVNDDPGNTWQEKPAISSDRAGNFIIIWRDDRHTTFEFDIYAQIFTANGNRSGPNFRVNDDPVRELADRPTVSMVSNGSFTIAWDTNYDIFAQTFNGDGTPLGSNIQVSVDTNNTWQRYASVSTDEYGNFIISWMNWHYGQPENDIYAQRYRSDGTALGQNFLLTNTANQDQLYPAVLLRDGLIYSTWADNRARGSGYDIWANILEWDDPQPKSEPSEFTLYQNYPNPFNRGTTIEIYLMQESQVKLTVFNILGQQVATLISGPLPSGFHAIPWQGSSGIASGVYIYRLEAGTFTETKKMVLMR